MARTRATARHHAAPGLPAASFAQTRSAAAAADRGDTQARTTRLSPCKLAGTSSADTRRPAARGAISGRNAATPAARLTESARNFSAGRGASVVENILLTALAIDAPGTPLRTEERLLGKECVGKCYNLVLP